MLENCIVLLFNVQIDCDKVLNSKVEEELHLKVMVSDIFIFHFLHIFFT